VPDSSKNAFFLSFSKAKHRISPILRIKWQKGKNVPYFSFAVIDTITAIGTEIALLVDLDSSRVQNDKIHEFGE
jgi:hypothetical protein